MGGGNRSIEVRGNLEQKKLWRPCLKNMPDLVVCPMIAAAPEAVGLRSEASWDKNTEPCLKNKLEKSKRAVGITQVVEYLPSKHKTLPNKKRKKRKRWS
jgi:hypothetical protein